MILEGELFLIIRLYLIIDDRDLIDGNILKLDVQIVTVSLVVLTSTNFTLLALCVPEDVVVYLN